MKSLWVKSIYSIFEKSGAKKSVGEKLKSLQVISPWAKSVWVKVCG